MFLIVTNISFIIKATLAVTLSVLVIVWSYELWNLLVFNSDGDCRSCHVGFLRVARRTDKVYDHGLSAIQ